MLSSTRKPTLALFFAIAACGGKQPTPTAGGGGGGGGGAPDMDDMMKAGSGGGGDDPAAVFGPLEVGADWRSYKKVNKSSFDSPTHGHRFVDIYVNDAAYAAYIGEEAFPVGSVIVKTSFERDGDQPSDQAGPIFVMEKKEAGFSPDHEDWYYAIQWDKPVGPLAKQLAGPIYWRSPSAKVNYCWKCHDNFDRSIGGPPVEQRAW